MLATSPGEPSSHDTPADTPGMEILVLFCLLALVAGLSFATTRLLPPPEDQDVEEGDNEAPLEGDGGVL